MRYAVSATAAAALVAMVVVASRGEPSEPAAHVETPTVPVRMETVVIPATVPPEMLSAPLVPAPQPPKIRAHHCGPCGRG
jgi:hypothetical protein